MRGEGYGRSWFASPPNSQVSGLGNRLVVVFSASSFPLSLRPRSRNVISGCLVYATLATGHGHVAPRRIGPTLASETRSQI